MQNKPPVRTKLTVKAPDAVPKPRLAAPLYDRNTPQPNEAESVVILDNKYRLLKNIGSGGMGDVHLAEYTDVDKKVAIKVLRSSRPFENEVVAAFSISHDNVVNIFGHGQTPEGNPYIVMEYLDGMDLAKLLKKKKPLPWPEAKDIVLQICDGLQAAHRKGVVHLDMKPMNVFMVGGGNRPFVKILDFGLSRLSSEVPGIEALSPTSFAGTPAYAPPEQHSGSKECDHRSDIYAVGVMLYEMLCGRLPFVSKAADSEKRAEELMLMHKGSPPPTFSVHGVSAPDGVETIVMRSLEKRKEDRFQSAVEMAQALLAVDNKPKTPAPFIVVPEMPVTAELEDTDPRLQQKQPKSSFRAGLVAVVLTLLAGAGGAYWAYHPDASKNKAQTRHAEQARVIKPDASAKYDAEKKKNGKNHRHKRLIHGVFKPPTEAANKVEETESETPEADEQPEAEAPVPEAAREDDKEPTSTSEESETEVQK